MFNDVNHTYSGADATLEIIIMLAVAFLLGLLLGYFLWYAASKRFKTELADALVKLDLANGRVSQLEKDLNAERSKSGELQVKLDASANHNQRLGVEMTTLEAKHRDLAAELEDARSQAIRLQGEMNVLSESSPSVFAARFVENEAPEAELAPDPEETRLTGEEVDFDITVAVPDIEPVVSDEGEPVLPAINDSESDAPETESAEIEFELPSFLIEDVVPEPLIAVAAPPAAVAAPDDLKVIEGIGPAIERVLHEAGVTSFAQLADMSHEDIMGVLMRASERYKMFGNSSMSWAEQSALARDGAWEALQSLQDQLSAGRRE